MSHHRLASTAPTPRRHVCRPPCRREEITPDPLSLHGRRPLLPLDPSAHWPDPAAPAPEEEEESTRAARLEGVRKRERRGHRRLEGERGVET